MFENLLPARVSAVAVPMATRPQVLITLTTAARDARPYTQGLDG